MLVPLDPDAAFELFTDRFGEWWPKDSHHISEADAAEVFLEPREGGRWYERAEDGSECDWGHVLEIDRPNRILLAWQLTPEWKFDPDPAKATEVEVTFDAEENGTRVTLAAPRLRGPRRGRRRPCASRSAATAGWAAADGALPRTPPESAKLAGPRSRR